MGPDAQIGAVEQRQENHITIDDELERMDMLINRLEELRDHVKGVNTIESANAKEEPPRAMPSLADLLTGGTTGKQAHSCDIHS